MNNISTDMRPIGVFDSGVGGLTVLKSLMRSMPGENFLYLGDTARVPYGTKSADTIRSYSAGLASVLLHHDVKMIIIACNTASAHATDLVRDIASPVPVIGMIEPAAAAAIAASKRRNILVMGTQSTIRSACYDRAIHAINPSIAVRGVACQMLVALAEEGADPTWLSGDIAKSIITRYLAPYFTDPAMAPDTIILGCTHFPLLREAIASVVGPDVTLIENGGTIAAIVEPMMGQAENAAPTISFMVTDAAERFAPLARTFLGRSIPLDAITHIDLNDYAAYSAVQNNEKEKTLCSI